MPLFKAKKYNFNTADAQFEFDESFYEIVGNGGFEFCDGYSILHVTKEKYIDDINFYVHEFSEMALLAAIRKCTYKYRKSVTFKHFASTDMAHFIALYGYPNKRTLCPDSTIRKPYIALLRSLSKEEMDIRMKVGMNW